MNILSTINLDTIMLMVGTAVFVLLLTKWHNSKDNHFDLKTALADSTGRFSLSKFGQLVSMVTSTWVVIYQTRAGVLTEWLFTGYMVAWASANAWSKYVNKKKDNDAGVSGSQ